MADKYYAWSTFRIQGSDSNVKPTLVNPGDEVTAEKLKVNKDEFQEMVDSGAVRAAKWPVPEDAGAVSPIDYLRQKARETEAKGMDAVIEEIQATQPTT